MNTIYRIIWNRTLGCFVVASELATGKGKSRTTLVSAAVTRVPLLSALSAALLLSLAPVSHAATQLVDGTTYQGSGQLTSAGDNNPGLLVNNGGEASWTDGMITSSGAGSTAAGVQNGSTLSLDNTSVLSLRDATLALSATGNSFLNLLNTQVTAIGNSIALYINTGAQVQGSGLTVNSAGVGIKNNTSTFDVSNLTVATTGKAGHAINTFGNSNFKADNVTLTTRGEQADGVSTSGGTTNLSNINITTGGKTARGVFATTSAANVTLNGGSINTAGTMAHGIYATKGATVNVSNMDITTTAVGMPANNTGASALMIETGSTVNADSVKLSSAGNAITMTNSIFNGNNVELRQTRANTGPALWAFGSTVNLRNSLISGDSSVVLQGIYIDGGTGNFDNVTITGEKSGLGLAIRYNGVVNASHLNIRMKNTENSSLSGIVFSNGGGNNLATLKDSSVVVEGASAYGIYSKTTVNHRLNLIDSLVLSDNVALKATQTSALLVTADGSTISGKTLMQGGTGSGESVRNLEIDATNGSSLIGTADINRTYTQKSRISLANASAWQGAASGLHQLALSSGSQWTMTADSDVGTVALNDSQIDFDHADGRFKTLTVDGDFTGDNGTLVMNSILEGDDSAHDRLIVNGNTSGTTRVVVNNAGGIGAATLQGIELISVAGDSGGEFTQQGRIVAGAYDYFLQRGTGSADKNWFLSSSLTPVQPPQPVVTQPEVTQPGVTQPEVTQPGVTQPGVTQPASPDDAVNPIVQPVVSPVAAAPMVVRPEVGSYNANIQAANTLFTLRMHDRGGETQYIDALTGEQKTTSMWLRSVGGHQQIGDASGQLKTETNRYVMQLGGDLAQLSSNGNDRLHIGAMAGYGNAQSKTDSKLTGFRSKGQVNGYSVGLYASWNQQPEARSGAYVDSWIQYGWFNNSVSGEMMQSESYRSQGITASVEGGYRFKLGEDGAKNRYFIEPNAQIVSMNVKAKDLTESNGTRVSSKGNGNIQSRVGVRASMDSAAGGSKPQLTPWVEANWIGNSRDFGSTLNGVSQASQGAKNIGEVRIGVDSQLKPNLNLWGSLGQQVGGSGYKDSSAAVGIKLSF